MKKTRISASFFIGHAIDVGDALSRSTVQDALALHQGGRTADAIVLLGKLEASPATRGEAAFYAGVIHSSASRHDRAVEAFRRSVAAAPGASNAWNNLGASLRIVGDLTGAVESFRRALQLNPHFAEARSNLGGTLHDLGEFDVALRELKAAAESAPDLAEAKGSLGLAYLLHGNFSDGWRLYEERRSLAARYKKSPLPFAEWDGRPLDGQNIFLRCEQGFGDSIQFVRYATRVAARGGRVVLGGPVELKRVLATASAVSVTVSPGDPLPQCAAQCLLMSLPRIFNTTADSIPVSPQYLSADLAATEQWAQRVFDASGHGRRPCCVGLVWAGGTHTKHDKRRSIALQRWSALAQVPGVQLYSLQKGAGAEQLALAGLPIIDWTSDLHDFADTAALIANLDLVITVDTAVAHLAGALGKPVWVLIHYSPDWRWMLGRNDSPWYPSMRLFRQPTPGDWDSAISDIERALREFVAARSDNHG